MKQTPASIQPRTDRAGEDKLRSTLEPIARLLPGILACGGIAAIAVAVQFLELQLFEQAHLEALVIAILLGVAVRTAIGIGPRLLPGIAFCAKPLLEAAVALLGASLTASALTAAGGALFTGIVLVVAIALASSYAVGRAFGLPAKLAILVACGNAICGNSAIAAMATAIRADPRDVVSSIAFTAVLSVVLVLLLPFAIPAFGLSEKAYGVLAGTTIYAVPQVVAATAPAGPLALQVGTLVKLVRVLLLGPLILVASLISQRQAGSGRAIAWAKLVPWFIVVFFVLAAARSADLIPNTALNVMVTATRIFTLLSMAALGLGVDVMTLRRVGWRALVVVLISMTLLLGLSLALVFALSV